MSDIFLCGSPGCLTRVAGIYCDAHKVRAVASGPSPGERVRFSPGERIRFSWRGKPRDGVVEKVGRKTLTVVLETNGKVRLVKVRLEDAA